MMNLTRFVSLEKKINEAERRLTETDSVLVSERNISDIPAILSRSNSGWTKNRRVMSRL